MLLKPTLMLLLIALSTVTPCGAQAPSQQELERRTAFADGHFASPATKGQVVFPATAGSQTDRGRAYIALGPPDQIKDFECPPNTDCLPWEEWTYRDIPKIGRNVCMVFWDIRLNNSYKFVAFPCRAQRGDEAEARRRSERIRKLVQQTLARVGCN
jgi:GWxTD domain-containing protein